MIEQGNIQALIGNHLPPYIYSQELFVAGTTPVNYAGLYWDKQEIEAAMYSFLNGTWITAGENVHKFETAFSKRFNVKHSLMVNSGSSANLVLITALKKYYGWNDNDEVIVSPTGFPTTISVLCQNKLKPVFVDIEWNTLNFDLHQIESKITNFTKAIFLSPVLGNPPDMDVLVQLCQKYNIKLVLDNCDSLGSKWNGKYLNEYCVAFSNSFYPAHHISTGEGGMVCTNDSVLMKMMVSIAWWGRDCSCVGAGNLKMNGTCGHRFDKWLPEYEGEVDHRYVFSNMGYNLKPLDFQGAIGLIQLEKFDEIERKRKEAKERIEKIIIGTIDRIRGVEKFSKADTCWFGTPFICYDSQLKHKLVHHFENFKIQTRNYFAGNILIHPGYKMLGDYQDYPNANKVLDKVFFIGAAPHYTENVFKYIEKVVKLF